MPRCAHKYLNKSLCKTDAVDGHDYCSKHIDADDQPEPAVKCPACGGKGTEVLKHNRRFIDCNVAGMRCGRQNADPDPYAV